MDLHLPSAAAALLLAATAAAQPPPEDEAGFRDWKAVCDNVRRCTAIGFAADGEAGGLGPFLWLQREAGPGAAATVLVSIGWGEAAEGVKAGHKARLRLDGPAPLDLTAVVEEHADSGAMVARISSPADERRLLAALGAGSRLEVVVESKPLGAVSLSGSSAALRWIDDRQKRAGTVGALVARGPKPDTAQRPSAPVVGLVKPAGETVEVLPAALPAALKARADVNTCIQDQADPDGDFGKPSVRHLGGGDHLWSIPCGRGAYNFSALYLIAGRDGANARSPGLADDDILVNAELGDDGVLNAFGKGRGLGDCGVAESWAWDGRRFNLTERAALGDCQGVPPGLWPRYWTASTR